MCSTGGKKQTGRLDNFSRTKESLELWKERETNESRAREKGGMENTLNGEQ